MGYLDSKILEEYEVCELDEGEDASKIDSEEFTNNIKGRNFHDAAENYAREYNGNGDYSLMDNQISVVLMNKNGEKKVFKLSAEPDIYYNVEEV